ncbi:MAG: hypothetical protein H6Q52_3151 [Deltaproteobacteria bacterium]|nr:hypothetical protein [Deltaproteobacteria bacterium]
MSHHDGLVIWKDIFLRDREIIKQLLAQEESGAFKRDS